MKLIMQSGECCPANLDPLGTYIIHNEKVYKVVQENVLDRIIDIIDEHTECGCLLEV